MFGECHGHIMMDGRNYRQAMDIHRYGVKDEDIRRRLKQYKDMGVTFFRDGGDNLGVSERAALLAGEYGIDYRTPVFAIHKNGCYGSIVGRGFDNMKQYRLLIKEASDRGADFIKIMLSGIMDFCEFGKIVGSGLTFDEAKAMIEIAHEEGFAVMAHANGAEMVKCAVDAGVDSIEHGYYLDDETLRLFARRRTVWVPTLAAVSNLIGCKRFDDRVLNAVLNRQTAQVKKAGEMGICLAAGSDAGAHRVEHGRGIFDEVRLLKKVLSQAMPEKSDRLNCEKRTEKPFRLCGTAWEKNGNVQKDCIEEYLLAGEQIIRDKFRK